LRKNRAEIEALKSQVEIAEKKADSGLATEAVDRFIKSKVTEQELLNQEQARLLALKEAELRGRERIAEIRMKEVAADRAELDLEKDKIIFAMNLAQQISAINPAYADVVTQALLPSIAGMLVVTGLQAEVVEPPQPEGTG